MKKSKDEIISWDFQCWPTYKQNIRDILQGFGLELKDGVWQIEDSNPILNLYPKRLTDDGMGYGVEEEWITEVYTHLPDEKFNEPIATIFTEKEYPKLELWKEGKHTPYSILESKDGNELTPIDIRKENDTIEYLCKDDNNQVKWYSINEIKI